VLLFKPSFGISTPWAYGRMVARGSDYVAGAATEERLAAWVRGTGPAEEILFNNMEPAAFAKYVALPVLLERLRHDFGVAAGMSGSGSACFALVPEGAGARVAEMKQVVRAAWGAEIFLQEARLA
jgi:4-diphosphocytidyl-2-C-methyl-D-erythritol kinase